MEVQLFPDHGLKAGSAALPPDLAAGSLSALTLGSITVRLEPAPVSAPAGELHLAPDVWDRLSVPYDGLRLTLRADGGGRFELGPSVGILYSGLPGRAPRGWVEKSAQLHFGHLDGQGGLFGIGFDQAIDWERGQIDGYVLKWSRKGLVLLRSRFPIPAAVRLTWAIDRTVIARLREKTGNRTFNWIRSLGKWQSHTLLSEDPVLRRHLPETRLYRSSADLMAMLVRHGSLFVKHVHSIKGKRVAQLMKAEAGWRLRFVDQGLPTERTGRLLKDLLPVLRDLLGPGRWVVQAAIPTAGESGRSLHVRVVADRGKGGVWRCLRTVAHVAPDERLVITNIANGARKMDAEEALVQHYGETAEQARQCCRQMMALSLRAAEVLERAFSPLGLLGFDLAVEPGTGRVWLIEPNTVPAYEPDPWLERAIPRGQTDFALQLTGF